MTPPRLGKPLTDLFTSVLMVGSDLAEPVHALAVLRLLKRVNPAIAEITAFEAHQLFRDKRYRSARELLEQADAANPECTLLKAMLAATLFAQGDPLWEAYANEARRLPSHDSAFSILDSIDFALQRAKSPQLALQESAPAPAEAPPGVMFVGVRC